ncbi:GntP family permease [Labrenzia sp. PHM005]|uniref:GntP family permease n=1 Tax=Labrenzia sp. PHM005 TaxID=2590016 RepID=UPI001AD8A55F|nr:GntP family permease [Labrenzia sp. PHM005]
MDLLAILVALGLLMFLAFKGVTILIVAPLMALLAAIISGALPPLAAYTQIFMSNTGDFIIDFFPLFLLGAVFGKLMDDSGCAESIAKGVIAWLGPERAILAVVLCCAVLTFGGVSLFVVAFAVYPIAASLYRDADIPKRLIPGTIALGAFTFTMSALPGSPAIQNAIPMPFFGTTSFAAPGLGVITAALMFGLGMVWLNRRHAQAIATGEGYGTHEDSIVKPTVVMREQAQAEGFDIAEIDVKDQVKDTAPSGLPSFALAIAPVVVVVAVNMAFIQFIVPLLQVDFLSLPLFGETNLEAVRGLWAVIIALTLASLFVIGTNWGRLSDLKASLNKGADASVLPIFATASLVGFGAVVAALPGFQTVTEALIGLGSTDPLIAVAVSVAILSGLTGSASGGMSIALDALGGTFVDMAKATGTSLEAMHRITSVASGAMDALPHNGAVITVLGICQLGHKEAYFDVFMVAVVIPMISLIALIILASVFGSF